MDTSFFAIAAGAFWVKFIFWFTKSSVAKSIRFMTRKNMNFFGIFFEKHITIVLNLFGMGGCPLEPD